MSDDAPTRADTLPAGVERWMASQRWYAAKGGVPRLRTIDERIAEVDGVRVVTRLLLDDAPTGPVLYQVPFTERSTPVDELEHALVSGDGGTWTYDAPHDPAYARWLLGAIDSGAGSMVPIGPVTGVRVLSGEQSNTSVICSTERSGSVIVKVFRVLHHGDNPDVTTQEALSGAGSERVPRAFGALRGSWPDAGRPSGSATGHLAFAQEFLPGLEDAWRVALRSAREGESFAERAEALGAALAEVHTTLAGALPTVAASPAEVETVLASMQRRLDQAAREVPQVAEHADAVRRVYERVATLPWPDLQRVHGDLHLGQVLSAPGARGWVFLDFEGEPLRPMEERSRPDVPLRDVAGMLRSFDYVAGALAHDPDPVDTGDWAADAREAFLRGYERGTGAPLGERSAVVDAFELDKAVYEVVYETRNRPTWVGIPVDAVARLVARTTA